MAVVFVLGPSEWDTERAKPLRFTPRSVRERIVRTLSAAGHNAFIMEASPETAGEDILEKFERLVRERKVTDILVYWPPAAKMQATYDELILLRSRMEERPKLRVWIAHHEAVAEIRRGEFKVLEKGGRSRYLDSVAKLGVHPLSWTDHEDLDRLVALLCGEL